MATVLQPHFPIPDRTKQAVRLTKGQDGTIDIGWCEGIVSDGRAFRAELWAQDQVTVLTIFFSALGLENLDEEAIKRLVEREGLVSFRGTGRDCSDVGLLIDDGGNEVWSVNVTVADDEQKYVDNSVPIVPYSKDGGPDTMFNRRPIRTAHRTSAGERSV